ncbi:MAG: hypothetical protein Q4C04_02660 [Clostridia bacterium]|nr:hypothetical protein [Clostridia bacterium]
MKRENLYRLLSSIALLLAAAVFVAEFILLFGYLEGQTSFYVGSAAAFALPRLFPLPLAALLAIAAAFVPKRKLGLGALIFALVAALCQFFMIKITDVHPYFVTYSDYQLWGLYAGAALLLIGGALKLKSK